MATPMAQRVERLKIKHGLITARKETHAVINPLTEGPEETHAVINPLTEDIDKFIIMDNHKVKYCFNKDIKLLIGTPTYFGKDYCVQQFLSGIKDILTNPLCEIKVLIYDNSKVNNEFTIKMRSIADKLDIDHEKLTIEWIGYIFDNNATSREVISETRNLFRKYVLRHGHTHFLSLEADIIINQETLCNILKNSDKQVVFGLNVEYGGEVFYKGINKDTPHPSWTKASKTLSYTVNTVHPLNTDTIEVAGGFLGCTLISRDVLDLIKFRCDTRISYHDDFFFSFDCDLNDIKMYGDSSMTYQNLGQGITQWVNLDGKCGNNGYWRY